MAFAARLLCICSFLFLRIGGSYAATVAFLDTPSVPYLRSSVPGHLSGKGYRILQTELTSTYPSEGVLQADSDEVAQFLVPEAFNKPRVVWTIDLYGAEPWTLQTQGTQNSKDVTIHVAEITGSSALGGGEFMAGHSMSCRKDCLDRVLGTIATELRGSYTRGRGVLNGVLHTPRCSKYVAGVPLKSKALSLWAMEMAKMWTTVASAEQSAVSYPVEYRSTIVGLQWIKQTYGDNADVYRFASCFTAEAIEQLHMTLDSRFDGHVLTSVVMHRSADSEAGGKELHARVLTHRRRLFNALSKNDGDKPLRQKVTRFQTHTVAYIIFLLILFTAIGAMYAMSNMDFTKDTLLYAQVKLD